MPKQKSAWAEITERLVSSPGESPKQRSPTCTFGGCFNLKKSSDITREQVRYFQSSSGQI
jgi:hypothetical protein